MHSLKVVMLIGQAVSLAPAVVLFLFDDDKALGEESDPLTSRPPSMLRLGAPNAVSDTYSHRLTSVHHGVRSAWSLQCSETSTHASGEVIPYLASQNLSDVQHTFHCSHRPYGRSYSNAGLPHERQCLPGVVAGN